MEHKDCNCGNNSGHDHSHGHDCGGNCGHDHSHGHETVTISLDGETDLECSIIGTFDVEDKEYIALLPMEDEEVLIFSFKDKDGEIELSNIESDEEFEAVSSVFNELFLVGDDLDGDDFDDEDDEFEDEDDDEDFDDEDDDSDEDEKTK